MDKYDNNLKKVLNFDAINKIEDIYKINDMLSKNKLSLNIINKSNVDIIKKPDIPSDSDSDSDNEYKPTKHSMLSSDDEDESTKNDSTKVEQETTDKLEIASVIENIVPNCKLVKYTVREKLLQNYFDEILYEIFSDNTSRICSFNTLLLLLKHNNIIMSVVETKNLLVKLYEQCTYNKNNLEKYIYKQKKEKFLTNKKVDLTAYILSQNYYISMIDLYFILKHFKIPHIYISTTAISFVKKYNFFIGYYNNNNDNYYMIKIPSSFNRSNNIINYKLLIYNNKLEININSIIETDDNLKNNLLKFVKSSEKIDLYDQFLKAL